MQHLNIIELKTPKNKKEDKRC